MPRLMSVSLTEAQVRDRSKTITRWLGWLVLSVDLDTALSANADTIRLDVHEIRQHHSQAAPSDPQLPNQQRKVDQVPLERYSVIGRCRNWRPRRAPRAVGFRAEVVSGFALRARLADAHARNAVAVVSQGDGPLVRIVDVEVVDVRRERLDEITPDEVRAEGFPDLSPAEFVEFFCGTHKGCASDSVVTRIEWRYCDDPGSGAR